MANFGYNRVVMKQIILLVLLLIILFTAGCATPGIVPTPKIETATSQIKLTNTQISNKTINPTSTRVPAAGVSTPKLLTFPEEATPTILPDPPPTLSPNAWMSIPVVPEVSDRVREIYQLGLVLGNNPRAFSKIGDCGSTPAWFLGNFDRGTKYYSLGEHQYLVPVIQEFQGSYERTSLAAKSGFNASSIYAPIWANRDYCQPSESPLACEYRIQQPSFAFIMLGTNDIWHQEDFEPQMRQIIETSIQNGIIPILSTKADNLEGDGSINATIVKLAVEYGVPLWNYWLAMQPLPNKGLQDDGAHITWGPTRFDDSQAMKTGWTIRNLTALQVLDAVWQGVTSP